MVDIQTYIPVVVAVAGVASTVVVGKKWIALRDLVQHFAMLVSVYYTCKADGSFSSKDKDAIVACVGQFFDAVETEIKIVRPE